jgi:hypothetical protein
MSSTRCATHCQGAVPPPCVIAESYAKGQRMKQGPHSLPQAMTPRTSAVVRRAMPRCGVPCNRFPQELSNDLIWAMIYTVFPRQQGYALPRDCLYGEQSMSPDVGHVTSLVNEAAMCKHFLLGGASLSRCKCLRRSRVLILSGAHADEEGSKDATPGTSGRPFTIKRGGPDLQSLLASAKGSGRAVVVVFTDEADEEPAQESAVQWARNLARRHRDIAWAECDVGASQANRCASPHTCCHHQHSCTLV